MSGIIAQNASNATGLIKAAAAGGAWTLLTTSTASSSSTISFTSNINSTYPIYLFTFLTGSVIVTNLGALKSIFQFLDKSK